MESHARGKASRHDVWAVLWLLAVAFFVQREARIWDPILWLGDLGNLPYQCLRMSWGDVLYRDFAAKNPLGVFFLPYLVFRFLGPSVDTLAWLVALQFALLLLATYLVARRCAPRCAWIVLPLSTLNCLRNCGLIHHPWAGTLGLLAIIALYDLLFASGSRQHPRWALAGLCLGMLGMMHQVLFVMLSSAVWLYALGTSADRRGELFTLCRLSGVSIGAILGGYLVFSLVACHDLSLVPLALISNVRFMFFHQLLPANNPLWMSDLTVLPALQAGGAGAAQRVLEFLNQGLSYFGFPLLALCTLLGRRREGREGGWFSWLLLAGALSCLSAYPQFTSAHLRAFFFPLSYILIVVHIEGREGSWTLGLAAALVSLLAFEEIAVSQATRYYRVRFPVGVVYLRRPGEAQELQAISDELADQGPGQTLLVYPYFPMAYFLWLRRSPFRIHEIYPSRLLAHTGVTVTDSVYQEGLRSVQTQPPEYFLHAVGIQSLFVNLEQFQTGEDPGNPLLDFAYKTYRPNREMKLEDGRPWLVLGKRAKP